MNDQVQSASFFIGICTYWSYQHNASLIRMISNDSGPPQNDRRHRQHLDE